MRHLLAYQLATTHSTAERVGHKAGQLDQELTKALNRAVVSIAQTNRRMRVRVVKDGARGSHADSDPRQSWSGGEPRSRLGTAEASGKVGIKKRRPKKLKPQRDELCPVAFYRFRQSVVNLLKEGRVWRWNYRSGWEQLPRERLELIYPGQVFLLEHSCGGYDETLGWTGNPDHNSFPVCSHAARRNKSSEQDAEEDAEDLSQSKWLSIAEHTRHVCARLEELLGVIALDHQFGKPSVQLLRLAARWHDRGKAHDSFQSKIAPEHLDSDVARKALDGQLAAKAPDDAWRPPLRSGWRTAASVESSDGGVEDGAAERAAKLADKRRPGFRHELASALALLETLRRNQPDHLSLAWPDGLDKCSFGTHEPTTADLASDVAASELANLSANDFDLLLYLVACHHGKVRMSLRSSPDDGREDVPDPCPANQRQARGVRDNDPLKECKLPAADFDNPQADLVAPALLQLSLDPMELGLSHRYGPSWRERMQRLLETLGPFRLAYLESLLRAADCRASAEEDRDEQKAAR